MTLPTLKEIIDLSKTALTIEAQEKILELRQAALERGEQNIDLREQVRALQDQLALRQLDFRNGLYWDGDDPTPFCQRCCDVDSRRVRVQHYTANHTNSWVCRACNTHYKKTT